MWIPFFCNSTNILRSRMEIHESGYAWRYIRTYFRAPSTLSNVDGQVGASMTLVGLLPPLCDNGEMLVDGGYSKYWILQMIRCLIILQWTIFRWAPRGDQWLDLDLDDLLGFSDVQCRCSLCFCCRCWSCECRCKLSSLKLRVLGQGRRHNSAQVRR
jgi:hypothetical protein